MKKGFKYKKREVVSFSSNSQKCSLVETSFSAFFFADFHSAWNNEAGSALGSVIVHFRKSSGNKINWRNHSAILYFPRLQKYIDARRLRVPKSRKVSGDLSVVICGETIHSMGTPETIQDFENILSDLPDFEITLLLIKSALVMQSLGKHSIFKRILC